MRKGMAKISFSFVLVLVMALMAFPVQALAQTPSQQMQGRHLGVATRSDIRVFINGWQIEGFNIAGHMFVIAEELPPYGFGLNWDSIGRIIDIWHVPREEWGAAPVVRPYVNPGVGTTVFNYYHTDIATLVNGIMVPSYNIGDLTLVRVEDIIRPFGRVFWNPDARTLRAYTWWPGAVPFTEAVLPYDAGRHSWGQYTDNYPPAIVVDGWGFWGQGGNFFPATNTPSINQYTGEQFSWVQMGGLWYRHGIIIPSNDTGGPGVDSNQNSGTTLHRINGQFSVFSGIVGREDGTGMLPATIQIWGDGNLLWSQQLFGTRLPVPFEVNVEGIELIRIDVHYDRGSNPHTAYAIVGYLWP